MRALIFIITALLMVSAVSALPQTYHEFLRSIEGQGDAEINQQIDPGLQKILGTNTWQMYVKTVSGTDWLWFQTKDGKLIGSGRGLLIAGSTMKIELSRAVFEGVLQADDPAGAISSGIKSGDIKISPNTFMSRLAIGFVRFFGPSGSAPPVPQLKVSDAAGINTACNGGWDGPKEVLCDGNRQAQGSGRGSGCCEASCGADTGCDEQSPGSGRCNTDCKPQDAGPRPIITLTRGGQAGVDSRVGEYPNTLACEFYQTTLPTDPVRTNKKLVSCNVPFLADRFCQSAFADVNAKAVRCDEQGIIICTVPCYGNTKPMFCAFDNDRPRGYNAKPLDFCPPLVQQVPQSAKLGVGAVCRHGGECQTGNCVGVGMGPPWTYQCSCNPFRFDTAC